MLFFTVYLNKIVYKIVTIKDYYGVSLIYDSFYKNILLGMFIIDYLWNSYKKNDCIWLVKGYVMKYKIDKKIGKYDTFNNVWCGLMVFRGF